MMTNRMGRQVVEMAVRQGGGSVDETPETRFAKARKTVSGEPRGHGAHRGGAFRPERFYRAR